MVTRRRLTTKDRVRIFEAGGGVCALCGGKIMAGEAWDAHHEIELAIGGEDGGDNLVPAHAKCHRRHTAEVSAPRVAKTLRQQAKHLGASRSRTPMPCGRNSALKRRMDGTVVPRHRRDP